jgi:DNA-binding MarR family transcriptional regulator
VRDELRQGAPFRSAAQAGTITLLRTAALVRRHVARVIEPEGISFEQYNVLRILRGAGAGGLPTLAVRERLIDPSAAITRLVDKLEGAGLLRRERDAGDRRQVICHLTPAGRALLARMDAAVDAADADALAALAPGEADALVALLDRVRGPLVSAAAATGAD